MMARLILPAFFREGIARWTRSGIGSDVIEAGCRTVIGGRCKHSGMFWGVSGAEHILALRCINASQRDADFGQHRLAELAARKDPVPRAA
jgi:hypothetical protein